jgi:hypothetical protein
MDLKSIRAKVLATATFNRKPFDFGGETLFIREPTVEEKGRIQSAAFTMPSDKGGSVKVDAAKLQVQCALALVERQDDNSNFVRLFEPSDEAVLRSAPAGSDLGRLCEAAASMFGGGKDDPKESSTAPQSSPA